MSSRVMHQRPAKGENTQDVLKDHPGAQAMLAEKVDKWDEKHRRQFIKMFPNTSGPG